MPREMVLGNGEILINLDEYLNIRDIYYPYVGQYNHVNGYRCRVGVWTSDRGFAWLGGDAWDWDVAYAPGTLTGASVATHRGLQVALHVEQAVHPGKNIYLNRTRIENLTEDAREARMFFGYDLRIAESDIGDTAFYNPFLSALIHYKREFWFLMSGYVGDTGGVGTSGIAQYGCGIKEFGGAEGSWRDAEDGWLSNNAIAQGSVDSVIAYHAQLDPYGSETVRAWIAIGPDLPGVSALHDLPQEGNFDTLFAESVEASRGWGIVSEPGIDDLSPRVSALLSRSVQIIRSHADRRGAIIASTDSDIMETARAHYAYMWPRDGALVAYALDRAGYPEASAAFFEFAAKLLEDSACSGPNGAGSALMHKYGPDGTLGASWHAWTVPDGPPEAPIQEDGTALVVWAYGRRYAMHKDLVEAASLYPRLVKPAADFLAAHRDADTHLPVPSWDLWEERRGIHLYTTATVIGALRQAASVARAVGESKDAARYDAASAQTLAALRHRFWNDERGYYVRTLFRDEQSGALYPDPTLDSSAYALFAFGALPPDDPRLIATMSAMGGRLRVKDGVGGVARYERDYYFRVSEDFDRIPGNPWIICTLWLADWSVATAKTASDLRPALDLLEWATLCARPTGVLSEQVHPLTCRPLSVAPLTWSHAQFVTTALHYLEKLRELS